MKTFLKWYSPVFIICLILNCWLMFYYMFLKDDFTLTTAYIDEMAYSEEEKFFIEVNYYPNMYEVKINCYTDTDIPEKQEDGSYGTKYTYSYGVQFDGGYQYKRELDSNYFSYDYYYNKMINCYYYNTTDNGVSYTAISKLPEKNHWVYDVDGQLCLIKEIGKKTESNFLWVKQGNIYDTALMLQDLYKSVKSLEDGERVIAFDLSKYYTVSLYDGNSFPSDKFTTSEEYVFVNIKVNKSSSTFVSAEQSFFKSFKGNPNWSLYDIENVNYWRSLHEYNLTIKDFTFVYENNGYYLKLRDDVINFLTVFNNMKYYVSIDLDNIYLGSEKIQVDGFTEKPFGNLSLSSITLQTQENKTFKVYSDYTIICPDNLTIELLEVQNVN